MKHKTHFNYRHPVFYSRKHPADAQLHISLVNELVDWLDPEEAPF